MSSDRLINMVAHLAGAMVLAIGLAHFVMPSFGYARDALAAIPGPQKEHFVYLGTYAIGTFLVSLGILTLLSDQRRASPLELIFFGLMVFVWAARLALEFVYPVDLSLFFLSDPHPVLVATIFLILVGYITGFAGRLVTARATRPAG